MPYKRYFVTMNGGGVTKESDTATNSEIASRKGTNIKKFIATPRNKTLIARR